MPGARCTRGLVCKMHKEKRTRAYRFSGGNPAFPAQWPYGLCRALPGERIRLVTVAAGLRLTGSGWIDVATDSLAPATGVGTTRFCRTRSAFAKASADKARRSFWHRRKQRRSSCAPCIAHGIPPCDHLARRRCRVHRISSRVRDDARSAPLSG
jgi:hypothetical protein